MAKIWETCTDAGRGFVFGQVAAAVSGTARSVSAHCLLPSQSAPRLGSGGVETLLRLLHFASSPFSLRRRNRFFEWRHKKCSSSSWDSCNWLFVTAVAMSCSYSCWQSSAQAAAVFR